MGCFSRGTNFARNPETGRLAAQIRNRQTNIRNRSGRFFKSSLPWYWVGLSQTPCSSMTAHIRSTCSIASRNSQLGDGSVSKFEIETIFVAMARSYRLCTPTPPYHCTPTPPYHCPPALQLRLSDLKSMPRIDFGSIESHTLVEARSSLYWLLPIPRQGPYSSKDSFDRHCHEPCYANSFLTTFDCSTPVNPRSSPLNLNLKRW